MTIQEIKNLIITDCYNDGEYNNRLLNHIVNKTINKYNDKENLKAESWLIFIQCLNKFQFNLGENVPYTEEELWLEIRRTFNKKEGTDYIKERKRILFNYLIQSIEKNLRETNYVSLEDVDESKIQEKQPEVISYNYIRYIREELSHNLTEKQLKFLDDILDCKVLTMSKGLKFKYMSIIRKQTNKNIVKLKDFSSTEFKRIKSLRNINNKLKLKHYSVNNESFKLTVDIFTYILKNIDSAIVVEEFMYDSIPVEMRKWIINNFINKNNNTPIDTLYAKKVAKLFHEFSNNYNKTYKDKI